MDDALVEPDTAEDKENEDAEGQMSRLWVDRFSPRHYTELLSDDVRFKLYYITGCRHIDKKQPLLMPLVSFSVFVVYKPLSAQVAETLGHRCVWKRKEVPSGSV